MALDGGTTTLGGTTSTPILVGGDVVVGGSSVMGGNWEIQGDVTTDGVVSPGNSIGVVNVGGDVTFNASSIYAVEIAADGTSDQVNAGGQAFLNGGQVQVLTLDPLASYQSGQVYTILTADGGIVGAFDPNVVTQSIFLEAELQTAANQVDLVISIIGADAFQSAATTRNETATASALATLPQTGASLELYNALLFLGSETEAQSALNQLSGDAFASTKGMFVEQSGLIRTAMIDRLRASFGAVAASNAPVMAYGEATGSSTSHASMAVKAVEAPAATEQFALWTTGFGSWGDLDGNGNAADLSMSNGGVMIGADATVGAGWRLGVVGGYSYTSFDVDARNFSGNSENWNLGVYGGNQWGALGLRSGLSYTWHDIDTSRSVGFSGFGDDLTANYDAGTFQAFAEAGYRMDTEFAAFEPFANLAYVSLDTDAFSESGGAAALTDDSSTTETTFTTIGLRASKLLTFGGTETTMRGALGWRHAFGDITPLATQRFAGSDSFTVAGTPIAENAALIEAGLDVLTGDSTTVGIAYTGQFGDDVTQNGFNATLKVSF